MSQETCHSCEEKLNTDSYTWMCPHCDGPIYCTHRCLTSDRGRHARECTPMVPVDMFDAIAGHHLREAKEAAPWAGSTPTQQARFLHIACVAVRKGQVVERGNHKISNTPREQSAAAMYTACLGEYGGEHWYRYRKIQGVIDSAHFEIESIEVQPVAGAVAPAE